MWMLEQQSYCELNITTQHAGVVNTIDTALIRCQKSLAVHIKKSHVFCET